MSSGMEEMVMVVAVAEAWSGLNDDEDLGPREETTVVELSFGLGKQDFISHEKWRELQLSDITSIRFQILGEREREREREREGYKTVKVGVNKEGGRERERKRGQFSVV
ncbi:hypothetical protein TorRG33x02_028350 [Trema orientale]|uniref:Uncharacterized protein n=1 Tax=Trema orientale TaxID=63057 RepID=A0A2P5FUR2_TREOI|nr:hypothetical protein TorRG33x02_028350 [Trema orientale]